MSKYYQTSMEMCEMGSMCMMPCCSMTKTKCFSCHTDDQDTRM